MRSPGITCSSAPRAFFTPPGTPYLESKVSSFYDPSTFTYHLFNTGLFVRRLEHSLAHEAYTPIPTHSIYHSPLVERSNFAIMRLPLILGVVAAILPATLSASIRRPRMEPEWNITSSDISIPVEEPLAEVQCTGSTLDPNDTALAKAQAVAWSGKHQLGRKDMKSWAWGKSVWWVCNCGPWEAPLSEGELHEFERVLELKCGPNQSGWLWSHGWKKGFNLGPNSGGKRTCPYMCVWPKNAG